jgi:hypothetical protein
MIPVYQRRAMLGLLLLIGAVASHPVRAQVDPATWSVSVRTFIEGTPFIEGPYSTTALSESFSYSGFEISGSGSANISNTYDPSVSSTSTASLPSWLDTAPNEAEWNSNAHLEYFFEISGPSGQNIPVNVLASGSVSSSGLLPGQNTSEAGFSLNPVSVLPYLINVAAYATAPSFSVNQQLTLTSGTMYEVNITADSDLSNSGTPAVSGTAGAKVDPLFTISPSFALSNPGYHLEFSSNLSPVPEPAAGWLMLCGLAGLGVIKRLKGESAGRLAAI